MAIFSTQYYGDAFHFSGGEEGRTGGKGEGKGKEERGGRREKGKWKGGYEEGKKEEDGKAGVKEKGIIGKEE